MVRLLWIAFRAKKKDFLNINLAFFHNLQYLLTTLHFVMAFTFNVDALNIVKFLSVYMLIGGPVSLSFVCLERYVAVVHPTSYPLLKTHRCREACALSAWVLMLPAATVKAMAKDRAIAIAAMDVTALSVMVFAIGVIAWCNVAILKALKKSGPATDKLHPAKKRAFGTVRAISIIVLLCYIPVTPSGGGGGIMADLFFNGTDDDNVTNICFSHSYKSAIATIIFFTVLIGLPVILKMLWMAFHSKKTDVLNINYAVFHSLQYVMSSLHFIVLLLHMDTEFFIVSRFLFVYVLIGGPMTLSFICLERYIAVIHPTSYPLLKTRRCREVWALSVWLVALPTATTAGFAAQARTPDISSVDSVLYGVFIVMFAVVGAQLHYGAAPHQGAVSLVAQDHPDGHLHVGQRENEHDPRQHLKKKKKKKVTGDG
ncbi:hypothetical protein CRUP_019114 [Coryphaenoides rupestris]|nr:hypothetical protein CRUP_019114 [Coryphaenoides rupestris]